MTPRTRDLLGLAGFLAACFAVSAAGGAVTATSVGTWYQDLAKPPFNPPDSAFAPVWTALFVLMALAAWRVWRRGGFAANRAALGMFALQLVLNLGWSVLFFGLRAVGAALVEMAALWVAILVTAALFWRRDRAAGLLMVPYVLWVGFALLLNGAIWRLN